MHVVPEWSGQSAHDLRTALRLTIEEFAEHLGLSPRGVAKWEADREKRPQARIQQLLDVVLSKATGEQLERFLQLSYRSGAEPRTVVRPAVLDLQAPRSQTPAHLPAPASAPALAWLRSSLEQLYSADNQLGPRVLLPAVDSHVNTLDQMRTTARGPLLDEVLRVGSAYAEFAGWLSQDAGESLNTDRWHGQAFEWAEVAGDARMASWVLTRRAVQCIAHRDAVFAVKLAQAAQRDQSETTTRVRAIAAQTEGLAHALIGDAERVERCMATADVLTLAQQGMPLDGDPSGGNRYCELGLYLSISRAKAYLTLGQADQAITAFTTVIDALPADYRRDRGQYLVRLADAYAIAGLPEQGWARAAEAVDIARETGSSRTLREVARVATTSLAPWAHLPEGQSVRDMLAS